MERLDEWCETGGSATTKDELHYSAAVAPAAVALAREVAREIRKRARFSC